MFGLPDENLIENLERLRKNLCCYFGETCDCKFGADMTGEQTGCPEIRQAIEYLRGQRESVLVFERELEDSADKTLRKIRHILDQSQRGRT